MARTPAEGTAAAGTHRTAAAAGVHRMAAAVAAVAAGTAEHHIQAAVAEAHHHWKLTHSSCKQGAGAQEVGLRCAASASGRAGRLAQQAGQV